MDFLQLCKYTIWHVKLNSIEKQTRWVWGRYSFEYIISLQSYFLLNFTLPEKRTFSQFLLPQSNQAKTIYLSWIRIRSQISWLLIFYKPFLFSSRESGIHIILSVQASNFNLFSRIILLWHRAHTIIFYYFLFEFLAFSANSVDIKAVSVHSHYLEVLISLFPPYIL